MKGNKQVSQRNPMNDRYQTDKPKGQTKKSAASAKPKSKAASSVYIRSKEKTPAEKKAIRKQERARAAELDRMYYNPPTKEYKDLRRLWWILLISAIVLTVVSFFGQSFLPPTVTMVTLVAAYGCIIAALYIDFAKIRKVRRAYQESMAKKHNKAEKHKREQEIKEEQEEKQTKKKGFFSKLKKVDQEKEAIEDTKVSEEKPAEASKPIAVVKAEREAAKEQEKHSDK